MYTADRPEGAPGVPAESPGPAIVVVAHDVDGTGGMERHLAEMLGRAQANFRITVVSATLPEWLREKVHWVRVPVPARPVPLKFVAFWLRAGLALRRLHWDILHTTGAIVPARADLVSVHYCHGGRTTRDVFGGLADASAARRANALLLRALALAAERWVYRRPRARLLAAVSSGLADEVRRAYPEASVTVIPNGVAAGGPPPRPRHIVREDLRISDSTFVLLFVGGGWVHKGLPVLLRAVGQLGEEGKYAELLVVGHGDEARFRRLADAVGAGSRVRFLGVRSDMANLYAAADALVLPSIYETFSLVCYEAAAAGLPVVATRVHGVTELVDHGVSGLLVQRTPDDLAGALRRLIADPAAARVMGARARERVQLLTWDAAYARLDIVYKDLLTEGR